MRTPSDWRTWRAVANSATGSPIEGSGCWGTRNPHSAHASVQRDVIETSTSRRYGTDGLKAAILPRTTWWVGQYQASMSGCQAPMSVVETERGGAVVAGTLGEVAIAAGVRLDGLPLGERPRSDRREAGRMNLRDFTGLIAV